MCCKELIKPWWPAHCFKPLRLTMSSYPARLVSTTPRDIQSAWWHERSPGSYLHLFHLNMWSNRHASFSWVKFALDPLLTMTCGCRSNNCCPAPTFAVSITFDHIKPMTTNLLGCSGLALPMRLPTMWPCTLSMPCHVRSQLHNKQRVQHMLT